MRILITGATGFIGSQLVSLLGETHSLVLVSRDIQAATAKFGEQHGYHQGLIGLTELNNIDAVINLAGEPIVGKRWSEAQKQRICDSRWEMTASLAQLIAQSDTPPKVLINASAVGFYGRHGSEHLDEAGSFYNEFSHQVCQRWEALAQKASSDRTRVCILRFGIVLGLGGALAKMLPAFKLGLGGPIGQGQQGMSWIHQQDLLRLIEFMLNTDKCHGIYNATAPHPVSNAEFAKTLGRVLKRPALLPVPAWALKLLMGEMAELITEGQFVIPKRALAAGFSFNYPYLEAALTDLLS
ncbi:TIGR01777 family oxidoreductase [Shewanella sp. AS16]|uniref:TIGR01777 family oxidoreductase n=1 Tax=Shewanella sp. AS16 TaxID=2907625 RepID=UPI001F34BC87|nr:TIGR01777 family oxidoreductase [Shewanella sp. AS16]MCE9686891.1 TIGR01777 family oxidoreductase [Shewanella sp. AS16]